MRGRDKSQHSFRPAHEDSECECKDAIGTSHMIEKQKAQDMFGSDEIRAGLMHLSSLSQHSRC